LRCACLGHGPFTHQNTFTDPIIAASTETVRSTIYVRCDACWRIMQIPILIPLALVGSDDPLVRGCLDRFEGTSLTLACIAASRPVWINRFRRLWR